MIDITDETKKDIKEYIQLKPWKVACCDKCIINTMDLLSTNDKDVYALMVDGCCPKGGSVRRIYLIIPKKGYNSLIELYHNPLPIVHLKPNRTDVIWKNDKYVFLMVSEDASHVNKLVSINVDGSDVFIKIIKHKDDKESTWKLVLLRTAELICFYFPK